MRSVKQGLMADGIGMAVNIARRCYGRYIRPSAFTAFLSRLDVGGRSAAKRIYPGRLDQSRLVARP